jgi:hypothetical protein
MIHIETGSLVEELVVTDHTVSSVTSCRVTCTKNKGISTLSCPFRYVLFPPECLENSARYEDRPKEYFGGLV